MYRTSVLLRAGSIPAIAGPATVESKAARWTLAAWLLSAAVVTMLRCLNVTELGYDLTWQIEAGQNLLAGHGLSIYRHEGPDLAEPARLFTLTHFPAGFSLLTAALLSLGASLPIVVKVQGAAATMLGWWGWGRFGDGLLSSDATQRPLWRWIGVAIAVVTPLRYTPLWSGTDIVLWAAVPWVLLWVTSRNDRLDLAAGAVCGLCVLMRYASLFLLAYVGVVIVWQSLPRVPVLIRRSILLGLGCAPAIAAQLYINEVLASVPARPGGLEIGEHNAGFIAHRFWEGVSLLGKFNYTWLFWLPGQALDFFTQPDSGLPWRAAILAAVCLGFVVSLARYPLGPLAAGKDLRIVALGLFLVLPVVLWACTMLSYSTFMADPRYYWSLVPLAVLFTFALASRRPLATAPAVGAGIYVTGYLVMTIAGLLLLPAPGERGAMQRTRLIETASFEQWPSRQATYETYRARQFVVGLVSRDPNVVLLTTKAQWFLPDPALDRSRVIVLRTPCGSRPLRASAATPIVILTFDRPGPDRSVWAWGRGSRIERAECLETLPDLRLVARFPDEGVKVLESRVHREH
jgi:hypothetical protein